MITCLLNAWQGNRPPYSPLNRLATSWDHGNGPGVISHSLGNSRFEVTVCLFVCLLSALASVVVLSVSCRGMPDTFIILKN